MSDLETIFRLADREVDEILVSSHWALLKCVRSRALGDVMVAASLQDSR
jgi:hypothetical protein